MCPFCSTKIEKESDETGCQYYFGYLRERESGAVIPSEYIECRKNVEFMLVIQTSQDAVKEIKKWYK